MRKAMDDLRRESEAHGEQRKLIQDIRNVMNAFGVSMDKAMDSLQVP